MRRNRGPHAASPAALCRLQWVPPHCTKPLTASQHLHSLVIVACLLQEVTRSNPCRCCPAQHPLRFLANAAGCWGRHACWRNRNGTHTIGIITSLGTDGRPQNCVSRKKLQMLVSRSRLLRVHAEVVRSHAAAARARNAPWRRNHTGSSVARSAGKEICTLAQHSCYHTTVAAAGLREHAMQ